MLKNILNFEGVALLSKEEQKNVNGGLRNCIPTGRHQFLSSAGEVVSESCEWRCETTLLGITVGHRNVWGGCAGGGGTFG